MPGGCPVFDYRLRDMKTMTHKNPARRDIFRKERVMTDSKLGLSVRIINGLSIMSALTLNEETKRQMASILADIHAKTRRSPEELFGDIDAALKFVEEATMSAEAELNGHDNIMTYNVITKQVK
jgi:hypothetical protein